MGDVSYVPLIDDMVWSYSRARSFCDCRYKWYLKYIKGIRGKEMFFSSYGSFLHRLIEQYCNGTKGKEELIDLYLRDFKNAVPARAPNQKIFQNYFLGGLQYLKNMKPFPYNTLSVEKKVSFEIGGIPMIGFIDYLGESDGELYVVDHKSRTLRPRSTGIRYTKADQELDEYLTQLYLYSAAVEQEYGKTPRYLCFNCFRSRSFIREEFDRKAFENAEHWFLSTVSEIRDETDFRPSIEYFKCKYLCELNDVCEYYELMNRR